MKNLSILVLFISIPLQFFAQVGYKQREVTVKDAIFGIYETPKSSDTVVILFHDWFGISELSFETLSRFQKEGYDVKALDLYQGKSATTHQEASSYMNAVPVVEAKQFIDEVLITASKDYKHVILLGMSMGGKYASDAAIRNSTITSGLIVLYGALPTEEEQLQRIDFPTLVITGSRDNPDQAIDFFKVLHQNDPALVTLFIYPNKEHAFAQPLFNDGKNYDAKAKATAFELIIRHIQNECIK